MRHRLAAALLPALLASTAIAGEPKFRMHTIDADSKFEGAGVLDVNNDGRLDIQCGPHWYEAPQWKKHPTRDVEQIGGYHMGFCDLPVDVDGDGWTDVINAAWHNKTLSWVRNPGKAGGPFEEIPIDTPGHMETAILADINDDKQPDVLPNVFDGTPAWYSFQRDPAADHGVRWQKHDLPKQLAGPGVGAGDIDNDGRLDVVGCHGWAEQKTPDSSNDPGKITWTWRDEFELEDPGIPILIHDVDGDGDADILWGVGHGYGVYWLEQERDAIGKRAWSQHRIDKSWSQAHVVLLADLAGDGNKELITGKRYHAHNGNDPGGNEPRCLYVYDFDRSKRQWRRYTVQQNGPAGTGTSAAVADIDNDGDLDLIMPGKSGLYLFENLRK
jgi:hypothetical protein